MAAAYEPKSELRGDRSATWSEAVAGVAARLRGESPARPDTLGRAARYLNAAVNGRVGAPNEKVEPLEPTDDPAYEKRVEERLGREDRVNVVRKALDHDKENGA